MTLPSLSGDGDRLEASYKARAGEDDRFQQVSIGANRTDPREVRTDVSTTIADGVAGVARSLFTVEDQLTASNVARRKSSHELLESGFLLVRVDVEFGVQPLRLLLDFGPIFLHVRPDGVDPQARYGRRTFQCFNQFQAHDSSADWSKADSNRSTSSGPAVRSEYASWTSCSVESLARARTSAAVVR